MLQEEKKIKKHLFWLVIISLFVRAFLAATLELGNDEAYYWTYALFPDLSHFDHPPMVGWMIQFFSLNLIIDSEFFLRLSSLLLGTINILLVYQIGCKVKNARTGLYAAYLYVASLYGSIITGVFILPDTPLVFFWLISLSIFISFIRSNKEIGNKKPYLIWIGISVGLAMLSKYNGAFLWITILAFLFFFERKQLFKINIWIGIIISILIFIPVIIWNFKYGFISFTFQGARVNFFGNGISLKHISVELLGQMSYLNPIVFILIWIACYKLIFKNNFIDKKISAFLLLTGLPIIGLMVLFSFFRSTLPHWACPGYLGMLFIPAAYLDEKKDVSQRNIFIPKVIQVALLFIVIVISIGFIEIKSGVFQLKKLTGDDLTLDIFGWKQAGEKFVSVNNRLVEQKRIKADALLLSWRWFPGANEDYYFARKMHKKVVLIGHLDKIHKYAWINRIRGDIQPGDDAYFIVSAHDFRPPEILEGVVFDSVIPVDTILIERNKQTVDKVFVFILKNLKSYDKEYYLPE